jgi:hypothetical protein
MSVLVLLMPEKTRNDRDGKVSNGIISEYISPMGGSKTIVIIDGGATGMKFISVDPGQVIPVAKNFPVGSRVAFYWSEKDNRYVFQKPEAT